MTTEIAAAGIFARATALVRPDIGFFSPFRYNISLPEVRSAGDSAIAMANRP
ncbi:MAG: hypothetical protein ACKO85_13305 [Isosphaeraceae bacterium]